MKTIVKDRFLFRFSIVFKNDCFVFENDCFVFENDCFYKNDLKPFLIRLFFLKNDHSWKNEPFKKNILTVILTIVNEGSSLKVVNEGLLITIVNETTYFVKTVVFGKRSFLENDRFWKKLHAVLLNIVLHEVKQLLGS